MGNQKAWSFSRWNVYNTCPLQYKLKFIDGHKEPQSPAMKRGNEIHLEAARYLQGTLDVVPESCKNFANEMEELRELDPIVEQKWGFTANWKSTGFFGHNVWLRAILDAGVVYDDGTADVIDHKTGKKYETNQDQVELFALVTMHKFPQVRSVTTRLWYLDIEDDNEKQVLIDFTSKDKKGLTKKWEDRVSVMFSDELFAPRPNDKCRFCAFRRDNGGPCKY